MKRSAFKVQRPPGMRPPRAAKQIGPEYTPRPRTMAVAVAGPARAVVAVPKTVPVEHEGYRRLVAALPCIVCHRMGCQAAHQNTGKGVGTKTDDRLTFPLCADGAGRVGCHTLFDQGLMFRKEDRRDVEPDWSRLTREEIRAMGHWPATLPAWAEDEVVA